MIPPIDFRIFQRDYNAWLLLVLFSAFLAVFTIFLRIPLMVKVISLFCFINCFFSTIPYASWTAFISIVFCIYFFIACLKIKCWHTVFKVLQTILFLNLIFLVIQIFGKDNLLNFGRETYCLTIQGQSMQAGSVSVILSAALLAFSPFNIIYPFIVSFACCTYWTLVSAVIGGIIILSKKYLKTSLTILFVFLLVFACFARNKVIQNVSRSGRLEVWMNTLELTRQHPIMGYGAGTYKNLYPVLCKEKDYYPYKTAHSDPIENFFEMGAIGFSIMAIFFINLWTRLLCRKKYLLLAGLSMILVDMLVHFPMRTTNIVLVMILFFAYATTEAYD